MHEAETLPFYKEKSDRHLTGIFFVRKSENTLISYLDLRKMRITDQLQIFSSGKIGKQHFLIPRPPEQGNGGARDERQNY